MQPRTCRTPARRALLAATALGAAVGLGCGGSSSSTTTTPPAANINISAQLVAGTVTTSALYRSSALTTAAASSAATTPLAGYVLYCVTFQSSPVAASATADASGNVALTLAAKGVAFGCFVRDTGGNTVATLSFQSGSTAGTTLTESADVALGAVTVDTTTGLATATVSSGTVASTPPGATCPTGYWIVDTGPSECDPGVESTARVWVTPSTAGGYTVTIIHGPSYLANTNVCGYESFGQVPATFSGGVLTVGPFETHQGSTCHVPLTVALTVNSACTSASAAGSFVGCSACGTGANICSGSTTSSGACGTMTCPITWSATKQ